jgi:Cytochrome c554 and c-prime
LSRRSFATVFLAIVAGLSVRRASSDVPPAASGIRPAPTFRVQGVGSCAAAGCHNANGPAGSEGSEYSTWAGRDKHARAYEVLREPRSVDMVRKLGWAKAHEEPRCLACHATTGLPSVGFAGEGPAVRVSGVAVSSEILADGVGCESCHGPSEKWRTIHYQASWKALSADAKWQDGLFPTKDLARRVGRCVECHVGGPAREVNHDMIAAGHPRLTFEYTAYHHLMPRHWSPDKDGPNFEVRAWLLGQVATAKASVELLEARAEHAAAGGKIWPELAEYNCYACHHSLQAESWRQQRGYGDRKPGAMPWADWSLFGPRALVRLKAPGAPDADPFAKLSELMNNNAATPADVAAAAKATAKELDDWLTRLKTTPPSAQQVRALVRAMVNEPLSPADWDQAAQQYLGLVALITGLGEMDPAFKDAKHREPLARLRQPLTFDRRDATTFDSPTRFTPAEYRAALDKLRAAFDR